MAARQKTPLRPLTEEERLQFATCLRATSERVDRQQRVRALQAVADGASFSEASRQAGYRTGDGVKLLVLRFNAHGLAALDIAEGRGRKPTYGPTERSLIIAQVQRSPDRAMDGTATWSLKLLERALRHSELPQVSADTIRTVLHAAGYTYQRTRTWCATGTAERLHKRGRVIVRDRDTEAKKN